MIYFFDHDFDNEPWYFLSSFDAQEYESRFLEPDMYQFFNENDIVFLHVDEGLESWYEGIMSGKFKGHLILLRSTGESTPVENEAVKNSGHVHVCSLTPREFEKNATKIFQHIQTGKWEILDPSYQFDYLITLCILCQGYLAVHSDSKGQPEGINDSEDIVKQAFEVMKWPEFCQSRTAPSIVPYMSDDTEMKQKTREKLRNEVTSIAFWSSLVDLMDSAGVVDDIKQNEWDILQSNGEWEPVKNLFQALKDNKTPGEKVGLVAHAFIQLASKLGESHD